MSQAGSSGVNGGGGGGSITFTGDTGTPFTTSSVTIFSNNASNNSGASVLFNATSPNLTLDVTDGNSNVMIGNSAGVVGTGGTYCTALGQAALNNLTSGSRNTAIGQASCLNMVAINDVTGLGFGTLQSMTSGTQNLAVGGNALNTIGTGSQNTAVGVNSIQNASSGTYNTACGQATMYNLVSGSYNTVAGWQAGYNYRGSESSNIIIGNAGVESESHVIRIGNQGSGDNEQSTCAIAGITGSTVTGTAVLCDSNGNLGTISSSERYKENIRDISSDTSILHLRPVSFNYKKTDEKAFGFIAEEVDKIFPSLCVYDKEGKPDSVKYHYMYALLLEEIKRLNLRVQDLENKVK